MQITAVIQFDISNGCFILTIEGSPTAPSACEVVIWCGYASTLLGNYTRLCGAAGGCATNSGVMNINVH